MKFYNSLTKTREEFEINNNHVRMYACGPTVYNYFHIGNARCFVVFDLLRRYLEYRGNKVTFVQNFTDIDDKMIKRAAEENTTVKEVAEKYIEEYFTDAKGLGVNPASVHPRATENMDEIINIIKLLVEKGYAYPAENGDVYYSARSFGGYGQLGGFDVDDLDSGARIEVGDVKRDPLDFALWKAYKEGEPWWDSPWGRGRPGWHIECSAMVDKYLGKTIDIHCGGQDLTFPHHENEIAQSEAAFGVPFCRFFLHNGYINVDNKKMSKSLGNFFTVRDAAEKYGYAAIRFFLISSHYRSPINFTSESLSSAKASLDRLYNCENALRDALASAKEEGEVGQEVAALDSFRDKFIEAMDDDFNTADAVSALFELTRSINILLSKNTMNKSELEKALALWEELSGLLGFLAPKAEKSEDDEEIEALVQQRLEAKKAKNFALADSIRDQLRERGIILEDTPGATKWKRA